MKIDREGERERDSLKHTKISCGDACWSMITSFCHSISSFLSYVCGGMRRKRIVFLRRIGNHKTTGHLLHLLQRCVLTSLTCGSYVHWTKFEICTPDLLRCECSTAFPLPLPLPKKKSIFCVVDGPGANQLGRVSVSLVCLCVPPRSMSASMTAPPAPTQSWWQFKFHDTHRQTAASAAPKSRLLLSAHITQHKQMQD
jgi:hypothetical protein